MKPVIVMTFTVYDRAENDVASHYMANAIPDLAKLWGLEISPVRCENYQVPTSVEEHAARAIDQTVPADVAHRYVSALADIVAVLGPNEICSCKWPDECGLHYEAESALQTAKDALAGKEPTDGRPEEV